MAGEAAAAGSGEGPGGRQVETHPGDEEEQEQETPRKAGGGGGGGEAGETPEDGGVRTGSGGGSDEVRRGFDQMFKSTVVKYIVTFTDVTRSFWVGNMFSTMSSDI